MLENVASSHNELRMIKTQADQLKAINGSVLTYAQYNTLLKSSANTYDASLSGNTKNHARSVYMSEQSHNAEQTRPSFQRPIFQSDNRQHNSFQNNARPPNNF